MGDEARDEYSDSSVVEKPAAVATPDEAVLDAGAVEQLNNTETRRILDTIDGLRDLQIAGMVDLPQIIVVGDQCSGKSSVLEAISRVHFPVSDGICTRFATELVLRRAPQESTDLRIRSANQSQSGKDPARAPFQRSGFGRGNLPDVIQEAKDHMGVSQGQTMGFSEDVLRVELAGPDIPSLTLVDLPGIFKSGVASQPKEWKPVVDKLVESYMKQENSIIMMVVSANISLSQHEILDKALSYDPKRERTIGVITKVDLCPGENVEHEYVQLVKGQETQHRLPLGWHLLRNSGPSEREVDLDERDAREERFLNTGTWASLPSSCRGVDGLRKKLGTKLLSHVRGSLPGLIRDIENNLESRQKRLARLGRKRTETDELRSYLLDISTNFHRLTEHAIEGRYNDPFFGDSTIDGETGETKLRRLRALIRNLNRAFFATLLAKGATYEIEWDAGGSGAETVDIPDYLQPFVDLYDFPDPIATSESTIRAKLERFASASQGVEFPGLPNTGLIMQLFRAQSQPWRHIAESHLNIVMEWTKLFVYSLFDYILEDDKSTRDAILAEYVDKAFSEKKAELQARLNEILRPFVSGYGLPLEPDFRTEVSKRKVDRMAHRVADILQRRNPLAFNSAFHSSMKREDVVETVRLAGDDTTSDFGTDVVIDMMMTHYDISLRTFTENVIHLVIESCLISSIPEMFSIGKVARMNDETLNRLAEESDEVKTDRDQLKDDIAKLKIGLQSLHISRPRDFLVLSRSFADPSPPEQNASSVAQGPKSHKTDATSNNVSSILAAAAASSVLGKSNSSTLNDTSGNRALPDWRSALTTEQSISLKKPSNSKPLTTGTTLFGDLGPFRPFPSIPDPLTSSSGSLFGNTAAPFSSAPSLGELSSGLSATQQAINEHWGSYNRYLASQTPATGTGPFAAASSSLAPQPTAAPPGPFAQPPTTDSALFEPTITPQEAKGGSAFDSASSDSKSVGVFNKKPHIPHMDSFVRVTLNDGAVPAEEYSHFCMHADFRESSPEELRLEWLQSRTWFK